MGIEPFAQHGEFRGERHHHAEQRIDARVLTRHDAPSFVNTVALHRRRCVRADGRAAHAMAFDWGFRAEAMYQDL